MILEELAGMAFDSKETSFVILDGLDECLPEEAKKTLSWFQSHLKNSSKADSGHLRLLCVGQRVDVLQRELSSAADITLDQNASHLEDVERYVKEQANALKADFELSSQDETEIVTRVVGGAKSKNPSFVDVFSSPEVGENLKSNSRYVFVCKTGDGKSRKPNEPVRSS